MTLSYDLFWSFRSPYSYLVTPRLLDFEREYDVRTNVRPVYPIAVRAEGFFKSVNPLLGTTTPHLLVRNVITASRQSMNGATKVARCT